MDREMELNGIVVIDKPAGITSAKVVAIVKKLLGAKRVGHTGTLDPFATGVLICCINQATRLAGFFLSGRKVYEAVLRLGIATDTQDATGKVISQCEPIEFSENKILSALKQFTGTIQQQPPVFSALKHQGVPLYRLARSGRPVQKSARSVRIESMDLLAIELPEIRFVVSCSAGTYIRTLCADIGAALGCGGHLKTLRRIESGGFTIREAISLQALQAVAASGHIADCMIDMAGALRNMPALVADPALIAKIRDGKPLTDVDRGAGPNDVCGDFIKVIDPDNRLWAILSLNKNDRMVKYNCVFHH